MKCSLSSVLILLVLWGCAADSPGAASTLNDNFRSPELDVADYVERFEGESREVAVARDALVARLGLRPGDSVADIGAGTGLFVGPLSEHVGAEGTVWAVDISPRFVEHLRTRAEAEDMSNVRPLLCDSRSTNLPADSIDLAWICDTYHHFEFPAETLASLHQALKPGGRLVIVDFERIPGVSRPWMLDHVRAGKEVFTAEIEAAGFVLSEELQLDELKENYVLVFRKIS